MFAGFVTPQLFCQEKRLSELIDRKLPIEIRKSEFTFVGGRRRSPSPAPRVPWFGGLACSPRPARAGVGGGALRHSPPSRGRRVSLRCVPLAPSPAGLPTTHGPPTPRRRSSHQASFLRPCPALPCAAAPRLVAGAVRCPSFGPVSAALRPPRFSACALLRAAQAPPSRRRAGEAATGPLRPSLSPSAARPSPPLPRSPSFPLVAKRATGWAPPR